MKWHLNHRVHGARPWPVQVEAMRRSDWAPEYMMALEQGLGKQPLILNEWYAMTEIQPSAPDIMLNVAPYSFVEDWKLAPGEWGLNVPSGSWPRDPVPLDVERAVYSINYESMRAGRGLEALRELFRRRRVFLHADETGNAKNPQSLNAKRMIELSKSATVVRESNGTPMVQNVLDWWSQLRILKQLDGVNPFQFRNRYAVMGGYMGRVVRGINPDREAELYSIIDRVAFRALKKDWWKGMPDKVRAPIHLEMTRRQRHHYQEMLADFFTSVNGLDVPAEMVITQQDKLRQLSSCLLLDKGRYEWLETENDNPKIRAVLDLIRGGATKAVVVYFYQRSGEALLSALGGAGMRPARIMRGVDVVEEKRRFNDDPDCRVIICQQQASFAGHTLIGGPGNDRCNRMIFYENSFSYWHRSQMEDRIHRGAQDLDCLYYDLITSPMDQVTVDVLCGKRDLADAVDEVLLALGREIGGGDERDGGARR